MTWHAYRLEFRLRTPLHAGARKVGYLQQTRRYVPARTLRGALIARLAAALGSSDYPGLHRATDAVLACGYFYLSDETRRPLRPVLHNGGTVYRPYLPDGRPAGDGEAPLTAAAFDYRFLTSTTSTAILGSHRSALDGSLHEIECLSPWTRDGARVYLSGYLFAADAAPTGALLSPEPGADDVVLRGQGRALSLRRDVLAGIQVGGERHYGFGRLVVSDLIRQERPLSWFAGGGAYPAYRIDANEPFPAHIAASPGDSTASGGVITGTVEPLVGRDTTEAGRFGLSLSVARVCWAPGSVASEAATYLLTPTDGVLSRDPGSASAS